MRTARALLLSCCLWSSACVTRMTDFTYLSTKNVDLSRASELKRQTIRTEGKDSVYLILFIPTRIPAVPNMKDAIDRAIESVSGGVALVNGVLRHRGWYFLVGESTYIVEGEVLWDPKLGDGSLRGPTRPASGATTPDG